MLEKVKQVEDRVNEIDRLLCDPAVSADVARTTALLKELKTLTPVAEKYREYRQYEESAAAAADMMEEAGADKALREELFSEAEDAKAEMARCLEELKVLLLPKDAHDERSVIIEIRSGAGGEESALFAAVLFRMYAMYAERRGWKTEVMNVNETTLGGYKEISFLIEGEGAFSRFKFESGVHRVQRIPVTEANGKIQTSTATVAVLPQAEEVDVALNPADLVIDTFRSSGAGGQHINKTESAIRITHVPTGTVVECQDERSQYKNKDKAMKVLRSRLLEREIEKQQAEVAGTRRLQVGTGDRSERIRTYNYPQNRVTDHRIGLTLYKLESILNGDLDELIDALITTDTADRLQAMGEED